MNNPFETWYPLCFSKDFPVGKHFAISILGQPLVAFRSFDGTVGVLEDKCSHRSTPLSLGKVQKNCIECPYHGWQFDASGACKEVPALMPDKPLPPKSSVKSYQVIESFGLVWVNMSSKVEDKLPEHIQQHFTWDKKDIYRFDNTIDVDLPYELMVENLLDPSHLPFAHHKTISNRKNAAPIDIKLIDHERELQGKSITYKSDGSTQEQIFHFDPPYTVYFDLFFKKMGIRQVHYCVPLTKTKMRINSIFFYQGMPWMNWIPFSNAIQKRMAKKIVHQDIEMLSGQYHNLGQGAEPWNQAVSADKLAKKYRQWLDEVTTEHNPWFDGFSKPEQL